MLKLLWRALLRWFDDDAPTHGAAVAFYTVFSLAPVVLITLAIAGLIFGDQAGRGAIFDQVTGLVGRQGARAVENVIESAAQPSAGLIARIVGPITFVFGATAVFVALQSALNRVWRVSPPPFSLGRFVRVRLLSFALVIASGFLATVSLLINAVIAAFGTYLFGEAPLTVIVQALQNVLSLATLIGVFTLLYRNLPDARVAWRDAAVGATATALLFTLGKFAISYYLAQTDVVSSYGAAGAFIVVLFWVYYSSMIFLFGAEVAWLWYERRTLADRDGPDAPTQPGSMLGR